MTSNTIEIATSLFGQNGIMAEVSPLNGMSMKAFAKAGFRRIEADWQIWSPEKATAQDRVSTQV